MAHLNGNPLEYEYAKFDEIANSSSTTLMKVIPAALLFPRILAICGTLTACKNIQEFSYGKDTSIYTEKLTIVILTRT